MEKVSGKEALLSVLPSCTAIRWNRNLFDQMLNSLEKIITSVNVGQLSCLPDQNAAYLCSQELIKIINYNVMNKFILGLTLFSIIILNSCVSKKWYTYRI